MTIDRRNATIDVYANAILGDAATTSLDQAIEYSRLLLLLEEALGSSPDLRTRLNDVGLSTAERQGAATSLFTNLPAAINAVLGLLFERDELPLLTEIADRLSSLIEERYDVAIIDVTTVVPLDDGIRQTIKQKYAAQLGCGIEIREHLDPNIMGGIIMQMRGRRIDASLSAQLSSARAVMTRDPFGGV
ncbi:MAG: F0F1 ATP synthase subunit delta [Coriobacteriia bacterium]|nr:F0F1 ATP synthase subunit delta [Coriobacteriia bacterium]